MECFGGWGKGEPGEARGGGGASTGQGRGGTSEEGSGGVGGTGEEGPGEGELDGCIMHRVHTSMININKNSKIDHNIMGNLGSIKSCLFILIMNQI